MRKNLLILTYFSYNDALTQAYTLPYIRMIRKTIDPKSRLLYFTLEQEQHRMTPSEKEEVTKTLADEGIQLVALKWHGSGLKAAFFWVLYLARMCVVCWKNKIDVVHCWNTPAGSIGYVLSLLLRKPLVIDSYEPHAEPMMEAGHWTKNHPVFRLLFFFEKLQSRRARTVIACVDKMKEYAQVKYGATFERFYTKPACVDLDHFKRRPDVISDLREKLDLKSKVVCVYAGKFGGSYLGGEVFSFLKACDDHWGDRFRFLLLSANSPAEVETYCVQTGFPTDKVIHKFVPHNEVPRYLGLGDFGLIPFVPAPSKRYGSPIKTGEYMAMGLPMVITAGISDDSEMVEEHELGYVMKDWNGTYFEEAIRTIENLIPENPEPLRLRIRELARSKKSFELAEHVYHDLYGNKLH